MAREHRFESCRDADCPRPYCRIWKDAYQEGFDEGLRVGLGLRRGGGRVTIR